MINQKECSTIDFVKDSLRRSVYKQSKLNQDILNLDGMSSHNVRHFLNNICSQPDTRYLEIGCYKGSTLIAALFGNTAQAIAVDNWSEFGNQRDTFFSCVNKYIPNANLLVHEIDSFKLDLNIISEKINVYFYDGHHSKECQTAAFTYYNDVFDNVFIAIVDDWNNINSRDGTFSAFKTLNYSILYQKQLFTFINGDFSSWWNGFYVAVLKKPNFDSVK